MKFKLFHIIMILVISLNCLILKGQTVHSNYGFKNFRKTEIIENKKLGNPRYFEQLRKIKDYGNYSLFAFHRSLSDKDNSDIAIKKGDEFQKFCDIDNNSFFQDVVGDKILLSSFNDSENYQILSIREKDLVTTIDTLIGNIVDMSYTSSFLGLGDTIVCFSNEVGNDEEDQITDDNNVIIYIKELGKYSKKDVRGKDLDKYLEDSKYSVKYEDIDPKYYTMGYNIYQNIGNKLEILSTNITPIVWSKDEHLFLGKKYIYGKDVLALVDLEKKTVQYILDVDSDNEFFYDNERQCFAYDKGTSICYILKVNIDPFSSLYDPSQIQPFVNDIEFWNLINKEYGLNINITIPSF